MHVVHGAGVPAGVSGAGMGAGAAVHVRVSRRQGSVAARLVALQV